MKGKLPLETVNTFRGGSYTQRTLIEDMTVYRVWGENADEISNWYTTIKPNATVQAQIDLAILPEWGNTATYTSIFRIPEGTVIYEGHAGPQSILPGGGAQIYIPRDKVKPEWIISRETGGK